MINYKKLIDISDHDITMTFSDLDKIDLYDKKIKDLSDSLLRYQATLAGANNEMKQVQDRMTNSKFKEFFKQDENGNLVVDKSKTENKDIQNWYKNQGYNWEELMDIYLQ